jgi:hypothetical protein
MTKEDILTMASEAYCWHVNLSGDRAASIARLDRFAVLVAAAEREACALAAEAVVPRHTECGNKIAGAIRARGQR